MKANLSQLNPPVLNSLVFFLGTPNITTTTGPGGLKHSFYQERSYVKFGNMFKEHGNVQTSKRNKKMVGEFS